MPKCHNCKHKTHIELTCSCGGKFCIHCRFPETHKCTTPVAPVVLVKVVAAKVDKI